MWRQRCTAPRAVYAMGRSLTTTPLEYSILHGALKATCALLYSCASCCLTVFLLMPSSFRASRSGTASGGQQTYARLVRPWTFWIPQPQPQPRRRRRLQDPAPCGRSPASQAPECTQNLTAFSGQSTTAGPLKPQQSSETYLLISPGTLRKPSKFDSNLITHKQPNL